MTAAQIRLCVGVDDLLGLAPTGGRNGYRWQLTSDRVLVEATATECHFLARRFAVLADELDRRELPLRTIPNRCPHCNQRVTNLVRHVADTGDTAERPEWACPVLFEKRNRGGSQ